MQIKVKLFATLRKYLPDAPLGSALNFDVPADTTLLDLFTLLEIPAEEVKLTYVNAVYREPDYRLNPDDEVGIFPPIGGGSNIYEY